MELFDMRQHILSQETSNDGKCKQFKLDVLKDVDMKIGFLGKTSLDDDFVARLIKYLQSVSTYKPAYLSHF